MELWKKPETFNHSRQRDRRIFLLSIFEDRSNKYLALILASYLLFSFFMITKFPKVWLDTSWGSIPGYTLATEGRLDNQVVGRGKPYVSVAVSRYIVQAAVHKIFGFGLWQIRFPSICYGFFLILITYWFARNYHDQTVAILATIILVSDNVFFVTARTVRPDIMVALLATSGFFLFLHGTETRLLRMFAFSGVLMGVSLYTHPNSFLILVAIIIIFLIKYRLSIFTSKEFWTFSLFLLIAFTPYAVYFIKTIDWNKFTYLKTTLGQRAGFLQGRYLQTYIHEYYRYTNYIYFPWRILIFLIQIAALLYAAISRRRIDRYLLLSIIVFVTLLPEWNQDHRTSRYFIIFIPALSILVSKMFVDLFRRIDIANFRTLGTRTIMKYAVASLIVTLFLVNQLGGDIYILWKHKDNDFYSFISEVKKTIPRGSKIWGSTAFWIGLYDYPYITQSSPYEEVVKFKPDYAILYDSTVWGEKTATVGRPDRTISPGYKLIRKKMEKLCSERGTFKRRITDKYYGSIQIYYIDWSE